VRFSCKPGFRRASSLLPVVLVAALSVAASSVWAAPPDVEVEALFTDAAVLRIDGQRKMLRTGQSFGGVTLVAAHSRTATLEVDGATRELGLSRRVGTNYQAAESRVVEIPRDAQLQYQTTATINGRRVRVLVDTGANVVAMNSRHAAALGVDYRAGLPGQVETAGGIMQAWQVTLRSVDVGGIQVDGVQASVVEGDFPVDVLLGMTFLRHVEMQETNGVLSLSRSW
jgi:aspartyl protease family protein